MNLRPSAEKINHQDHRERKEKEYSARSGPIRLRNRATTRFRGLIEIY